MSMTATRVREGVSAAVNDKMNAVQADAIAEDGMLFRVCEHGVYQPVGALHHELTTRDVEHRHYVWTQPTPSIAVVYCCDEMCCHAWR